MATKFRFKNADGTTVDFEDYYVRADYFRSGNLWTWGFNPAGQLGDNTAVSKSSPIQTIARGSNWKQVSCGYYHLATIKTDGTLWIWGFNNFGQLGDNTQGSGLVNSKSSPIQTITFGTNWKQAACGKYFTAGIKTDGTLWYWGNNAQGNIGDNTVVHKSSPVQTIAFGNNWKQVACGGNHTAAIKTDGTLWCCGYNTNGELGDNTITNRSSPVQTVTFSNSWQQISCGQNHTAAIKTDGTLWCWGLNTFGRLGDNTTTSRSSPVQTVAFGTNWKQVSCGYKHTAGIKTDGTLWLWGSNSSGQLGDNTITNRSSPVQATTFGSNWKQVSGGADYTGSIKSDGTLWCWGSNVYGRFGDNTNVDKSSPVQTITFGTIWKEISCGNYGVFNASAMTAAIQYQDDYQ